MVVLGCLLLRITKRGEWSVDTEELKEEEVNVYASCGEPRNSCLTDCLDGSAWLSTAK